MDEAKAKQVRDRLLREIVRQVAEIAPGEMQKVADETGYISRDERIDRRLREAAGAVSIAASALVHDRDPLVALSNHKSRR